MRMKKILLFLMAAIVGFVTNATTVTFDFTKNAYGLPNDQSTYVTTPATIELDSVSIVFGQNVEGKNAWRMWNDGIRAYNAGKPYFTVTVEDEIIKRVSWTVVSGATFALEGTTDNITSWEGEETSVTFVYTNTSENKALKTITVIYGEDAEEPEEPVTPEAPEGTIDVATALDLISKGYEGEATVEGYIISIDEISTQYGNATYDIADELEGDKSLKVFRGSYLNGEKFTTTDQIEVGGKVVVSGTLVNYNGTYEFTTGNKILEYTAPGVGGVEDILVEDDEVIYYNLLGVRVDNPTPGIYLARTSKGFVKVAIQ